MFSWIFSLFCEYVHGYLRIVLHIKSFNKISTVKKNILLVKKSHTYHFIYSIMIHTMLINDVVLLIIEAKIWIWISCAKNQIFLHLVSIFFKLVSNLFFLLNKIILLNFSSIEKSWVAVNLLLLLLESYTQNDVKYESVNAFVLFHMIIFSNYAYNVSPYSLLIFFAIFFPFVRLCFLAQ